MKLVLGIVIVVVAFLFVRPLEQWFWYNLTEPQVGHTYTQSCEKRFKVTAIDGDWVTYKDLQTGEERTVTRGDFKKPGRD